MHQSIVQLNSSIMAQEKSMRVVRRTLDESNQLSIESTGRLLIWNYCQTTTLRMLTKLKPTTFLRECGGAALSQKSSSNYFCKNAYYEIIDGELFMTRAPRWRHQKMADNVISNVVWASYERLAVLLDEVEHLTGDPKLIVKVLSPDAKNERR
jgi:hypothetical protein